VLGAQALFVLEHDLKLLGLLRASGYSHVDRPVSDQRGTQADRAGDQGPQAMQARIH